ncbi:integrase (plasmid) [Deinococcus metallilatus]|uniref:Integrase/recombinase XerC n=1 Tax=Deinococcus metallilatus TaxID=1211322 RepID=A0ABR6MV22_9DEIO|nr:tyrosine-type recombinase/integrase [Deinococcus metallilatus]MBB5295774.1 integrase/recombinase XerC [Deinococcus metallilatus]QBY06790.1 integrase [Deinococcus metallilatus]GMA14303.1 integrase [Deinococcus metallilatus]
MTLVRSEDRLALANLTDQALRVRAVEAASTYDTETLVQVTWAYMTTASRQGARTSRKTLDAYALAVRDFVPWAHEHGVQLLRPGRRDGGRYVAQLQTRPSQGRGRQGQLSAATVAQYVAGARALYRALRWAGATEAQPFEDAHVPPDPTPGIVKNPPYLREIDAVLEHCEPRLAALLLLCAHAGLRVSEALAVKGTDLQGARLTVSGKGGKVRRVPLGKRVRAALAGLSPARADGSLFDWTYAQATYRMHKAFRMAGHGGAWRGFHAARKHSGTRLYSATRDFTRVGLFLGHASVDTTRRYVAVADDDVQNEVEDF